MAILSNLGTAVANGASVLSESVTLTGYILTKATDGEKSYDSEDVMDSNGKRVSRLIFNRNKNLTLDLIPTTGTPLTDFPDKQMCPFTGLTDYFVENGAVSKPKGPHTLSVKLVKIFTND